MSKLMDELMAELNKVNELQTEVDRTVNMHQTEIISNRREKEPRVTKVLLEYGRILRNACGHVYNYFGNIPLDVYHNGKQIFIHYTVDRSGNVVISGGTSDFIQYHVYENSKGGYFQHDSYHNRSECDPIINSLIDGWDDECERKLEYLIAQIVKRKMAERMEEMQKKLADSNDEYARYFGKDAEENEDG